MSSGTKKAYGLQVKVFLIAFIGMSFSALVAVLALDALYTSNEAARGNLEQAHRQSVEIYRKAFDAYRQSYDLSAAEKMMEAAGREAEGLGVTAIASAGRSAQRGYRIAIVAIVVSMLLAIAGVWLFMRRSVLSPIGEAVRFAERISQGDLTAQIRARTSDEAGQLLRMLGTMRDSLAGLVSKVRGSAESVVAASAQVSSGTTDLSQRTEEQASSLEETAASMEELASTVRQNADNARQANELALGASRRAESGGAEVVRAVQSMVEMNHSAERIADITSVIDGIAFQTNILALNAAVEAARAGEQGRGFAVVASEVRSLAQRSAQAAKEIKVLIAESLGKAQEGTKLVEQAGETIQALVIDVKRVSDLMGSIAEASAEQSRGVQQVNKTVNEMDKVVQQNASAVQQSANAADGMRRQAESLARLVSAFRLLDEAPVAPAAAVSKAAAAHALPAQSHTGSITARTSPVRAAARPVAVAADGWQEF